MQPRVVLLKEDVDRSQGRGQIISNINACEAVFEILKTTLGPCGMDKLIYTEGQRSGVTISNDGATIIKTLDIVHPAARTLVDISRSQDSEVGDGTTSVTLLAGEFLHQAKKFVEDDVHPQVIITGYRLACEQALKKLEELQIHIDHSDQDKLREMLVRCAGTALNSKLISGQKAFFSEMAVDAIMQVKDSLDLTKLGSKRVLGGSVSDSVLIRGVAFERTFIYAGFEQQPKKFVDERVLCLNVELELQQERRDAEVRISDVKQYQSIVDAEWNIITRKLDSIRASGAKVVLSKLPVGDLAMQYFADHGVFCMGRVAQGDMDRLCAATGAVLQTSLNDLQPNILGSFGLFEERQVGNKRFVFFENCTSAAKTATIILRGGSEQFIAEAERSLHDAIMIVKRAIVHHSIVGGGGAIEMELAKHINVYAKTIKSKVQLVVEAYARALEVIPRQLSSNAGFDATDIINALRAAHERGETWAGVDIENEGVCDTVATFVWEPALVRKNAIAAATEAACLVLSVDETITDAKADGIQ